MSSSATISQILDSLGELRSVLDDLNVKYVTIAANGHWSFEKLGRTRQGTRPFDKTRLESLAAEIPVGRHARCGEWALRKYNGVSGASILIERLPVAVADRLPQDVLATLKARVKKDGNGLLVGEPGAGKGALLLWLALQIPGEPVLYVSENPPSDFPGSHVMHVFPPSTPAERRALERFIRLSPTVMWDRIASAEDLMTLYGYPGARRRWFTLDCSSVRAALRMLTTASRQGADPRFGAMLHLASSVIGKPEARSMVVRDSGSWNEIYVDGDSILDLVEAFEGRAEPLLQRSERSEPAIPVASGSVEVDPGLLAEAAHQVESEEADDAPPATTSPDVVVPTPEQSAGPFDPAPSAAPASAPDEPPATSLSESTSADEDNPRTVPVDVSHLDEESDADEAVTGMLARDEVRELREKKFDSFKESVPPSPASSAVPEVTRSYLEMPDEIAPAETAEREASYLQRVVPDLDDESAPEPINVNMSDLRITTMEDVDEDDLEIIDVDDLDEDSAVEDFSGVFDGELDFESLAEEMLSEMSEVEAKTEVGDASHLAVQTNPEQRIVLSESDLEVLDHPDETSDDDDGHTRSARADVLRLAQKMAGNASASQEDSTKEFTLSDELLKLRQQGKRED